MLHNSSSEDEAPISSIVGEDRHAEEDIDLEFNQADFDLRDGKADYPPSVALNAKAAKIVPQAIDAQHWPPSTYSASSGIFVITPKDHTARDPRLRPDPRARRRVKKASLGEHFGRPRGTFEPSYAGEPAAFIQYRMDAFASAWDMCLQRCAKVVAAHFKLAVTELCRFIRQRHTCWSWPINVIPTAVVVLGVDTSDYPVFFGVLKRHLKHGQRRVVFLDPAVCTSISRLMDSFFKQVIPSASKSSGYSLALLQRHVEEVREAYDNLVFGFSGFSLTIVVQTAEHWASNDVLSDFLEMISHYAAFLELTVVLQLSAGRDQLSAALPAATLQLMTSKTFHITSSSSAIDLVLKHTIFAKDAPFRASHKFLKWILENLKFLNHSISAIVTKLKLIYWRFFYTQPLSWITGNDGLKLLASVLGSPTRETLIQPFERLIEAYFVENRIPLDEMEQHPFIYLLKDIHSRVAFAQTMVQPPIAPVKQHPRHKPKRVYVPRDDSLDPLREALIKWLTSHKRSMLLKSTALELFVALKHFAFSSKSNESLSALYTGKIDMEDQLVQIQGMRDVAEMTFGRRTVGRDFTLGLAAEDDLEIHDWYGCPHAYEYYALMTNTKQVVHAALIHIRGDESKLRNVLKHWMVVIGNLANSSETRPLHGVLHRLFAEDVAWLGEEEENESSEEDEPAAAPSEGAAPSNHSKLLDKLLKKIEEVIIGAFDEDDTSKTPITESFVTSDEDVALLNRRFNPNVKPSQENGLALIIADVEKLKIPSKKSASG